MIGFDKSQPTRDHHHHPCLQAYIYAYMLAGNGDENPLRIVIICARDADDDGGDEDGRDGIGDDNDDDDNEDDDDDDDDDCHHHIPGLCTS